MSLKRLLDKGLLDQIEITQESLNRLLQIAERDIKDSQIEALSLDRRFATAYGAALNLATYLIRSKGYRLKKLNGHHQLTFELAEELLGKESKKLIALFDLCRRKRNKVDYDFAGVVTEVELENLGVAIKEFKKLILDFKA